MAENFNKAPAFHAAQGPGFHHGNFVAHFGGAILVMHMNFFGPENNLSELRMWNAGIYPNHKGFVAALGNDYADTRLFASGGSRGRLLGGGCFAHTKGRWNKVINLRLWLQSVSG
jgi:hypothetical protein